MCLCLPNDTWTDLCGLGTTEKSERSFCGAEYDSNNSAEMLALFAIHSIKTCVGSTYHGVERAHWLPLRIELTSECKIWCGLAAS